MLEVTRENDELLVLNLSGKLDAAEMEKGLDALLIETQNMQQGKMLYTIEEFEWPSFGAIMVEFGKMPSLFAMIRRIARVAVLADQAWLRKAAEWEGMVIPGLEIKSFERGEEVAARQWLDTN